MRPATEALEADSQNGGPRDAIGHLSGDGINASSCSAIMSDPQSADLAVYGFVKPQPNSLPLPIRDYLGKQNQQFQGNDRNIATFARFFNGLPFDTVK